MKRLFAIAILTFVASCAGLPQSPQQAVFAAKQDYAIALSAAVAYRRLPICPSTTKLCSDPKVVKQLQAADNSASALLDGAENVVRTPGAGINLETAVKAASQAVAAFTTLTGALNK